MTAPSQEQKRPQSKHDPLWSMLAVWLILRHRDQQDSLADTVEYDMARSWKHLEFHDLAGTEVRWLDATLDKLNRRHAESQRLSGDFVNDLRNLVAMQSRQSLPDPIRFARPNTIITQPGDGDVVLLDELDEARVAHRLRAAGPGSVKHAMPAPEDTAMGNGLVNVMGTAVELVGEGGRGVVLAAQTASDDLVGYQRVCESDNKVCAFCALLASRGPVYKNLDRVARTDTKWSLKERDMGKVAEIVELDSIPDSSAKAHTHCRCTLIPVFASSRLGLSGWAEVAERIWNDPEKYGWDDTGGWAEKRRAFRNAFDRYKASHPEEGADDEFDRKALKALLADEARDRTDYEEARWLSRINAGL